MLRGGQENAETTFRIICSQCLCDMDHRDKAVLLEQWNTRDPKPVQQATLHVLDEVRDKIVTPNYMAFEAADTTLSAESACISIGRSLSQIRADKMKEFEK